MGRQDLADWSPAEDLRPGPRLIREQPEQTPQGRMWTQVVTFHWPAPGYTQMTIREDGETFCIGHHRVYHIDTEDDGA